MGGGEGATAVVVVVVIGVMNERGQTQGQRSDKEALSRGSRAAPPPSGHQGNIFQPTLVSEDSRP